MLAGQRSKTVSAVALAGALAVASWAWAQGPRDHGQTPKSPAPPTGGHAEHGKMESQAPPPIRTTMEELHRQGGVPAGWQFLLPTGNPAEGKKVYAELECYSCHEIKGEHFPQHAKSPDRVGPELTGMGQYHSAEYLAEAIVNPNRVIIEGPGYTGEDGLSKMPDYAESMTLRQLIDLVAYLKSLRGEPAQASPAKPHGDRPMPAPKGGGHSGPSDH